MQLTRFLALLPLALAAVVPTQGDSDLVKRSEDRLERWNGVDIEVAPHSYATWDCKHVKDTFYNTYRLYGNNWQKNEDEIKSAANAAGAVTKWTYVETFNKTTLETSFKSEFRMPKFSNNQLERHLTKLLGATYGKHQGPKCPLQTAVDWDKDEPAKPVDNWSAREKWEKKHPEAAARQRKQEEQEELVKKGKMDEDAMLKTDDADEIPKMADQRWNGNDIEVLPGEYATWTCSHQKELWWDEFDLQGVNWHRGHDRIKAACKAAGLVTNWLYHEWTNEFNQTVFNVHFNLPIRKTKALEKKLNGLLGVKWKKYEGPKCTHISKDGNYAPGDMAPERKEKQAKAKAKWESKHPEDAARQKRAMERWEEKKEEIRKEREMARKKMAGEMN